MSWIPAFEIGMWNAWIPALLPLLHPLILAGVDKAVGDGNLNQKMGGDPQEEQKKKPIPLPTLLIIVLFIYSIFLPLSLGTVWFYLGTAIYLVGTVMFLWSITTAAKTPLGQVFTRGMYRYSRHPLYLSFLFVFFGISLACHSWLFLLISLGYLAFPLSQVSVEERGCLETFGNDYRKYMNNTPKWLGVPKHNERVTKP